MPISIRCPHCSAASIVKDKYAGKKVCCRECSSAFRVRTGQPDAAAQTPRPRINAASRKAFAQARSAPPPTPPQTSVKERCLVRKSSGLYLRPRLRRWGNSHSRFLVAAIFLVDLLLGVGITLAWLPSRPKAETATAAPSLPVRSKGSIVWVQPDIHGQIDLLAAAARVHGSKKQLEAGLTINSMGNWDDGHDFITWEFEAAVAGFYRVEITYACDDGDAGSMYCLRVGQSQLSGTVRPTGSWRKFRTDVISGKLDLPSGKHSLRLWARVVPERVVMNLHKVRLIPLQ